MKRGIIYVVIILWVLLVEYFFGWINILSWFAESISFLKIPVKFIIAIFLLTISIYSIIKRKVAVVFLGSIIAVFFSMVIGLLTYKGLPSGYRFISHCGTCNMMRNSRNYYFLFDYAADKLKKINSNLFTNIQLIKYDKVPVLSYECVNVIEGRTGWQEFEIMASDYLEHTQHIKTQQSGGRADVSAVLQECRNLLDLAKSAGEKFNRAGYILSGFIFYSLLWPLTTFGLIKLYSMASKNISTTGGNT